MEKSKMRKKSSAIRQARLWKICFSFLFLWSLTAYAADTPLALIRQTTERAVTVLRNPSLQGKERAQERAKNFWETVLPEFDSQEIAKRCLSVHWDELNETQKKEFVDLFTELVKHSYQDTLERHVKDAQFSFDHERVDGDSAEVETRVLSPSLKEKALSLNYRLHRTGGKWLIYDVVAENVSLVQNYRNQFNRILKDSSYDGLVQALRKKIQELQA
jgi:phospholipid transport system substrate-binding protein